MRFFGPSVSTFGYIPPRIQSTRHRSSRCSLSADGARTSGMWLSWLLDTLMQLRETGLVGQLCYALLLSAWTLACLPTTPIELAAGFIFPTGPAVVMSVLAKTCASMLGLFLGRQLLRSSVSSWVSRRFAVDGKLSKHLRHELTLRPLQTLGLIRSAPLPTPIKIYGISLLPAHLVPWRTYLGVVVTVNSVFSMIWALGGASASSLQDAVSGGNGSAHRLAAQAGAFSLLVFGMTHLARHAKAKLERPTSPRASPRARGEVGATPTRRSPRVRRARKVED